MNAEDIRISVVIPTFRSRRTIEGCLRSLMEQTESPHEILVVDQGSEDGTEDVVKRLSRETSGLRYYDVGLERRGIAYAMNFGARRATGSHLMFVGSDWYLDPTAIARLAQLAQQGHSVVVAGAWRKRLDGGVGYIARCRQRLWSFAQAQSYVENAPRPAGGLVGTPYFIERDVFLRLGGFDSSLPALEDADLFVRCVRAGLVPAAAVDVGTHDQTITLRSTVARRLRSSAATAMFRRKWSGQAWVARADAVIRFGGTMRRFLRALLRLVREDPTSLPAALLVGGIDGITSVVSDLFLAPSWTARTIQG